MKSPTPQPILLSDYAPYPFIVDNVELVFRLNPEATRVLSKVHFRPNPESEDNTFRLDGEAMTLVWARIDGKDIKPEVSDECLVCEVPDGPFVWEAEVEINPSTNTALEGLYMSKGMYSTQCEAEGFRRITYYPDRPDVMAPFKVRIEGEEPIMLSNGNPTGAGDGWAEWDDPWPKPSYLFALVAGDLVAHSDRFTTASGRDVALNIWVRPGDEAKCGYAMDALKRSMTWDEEKYGREYDLDLFNIVAVDDFNAGAMENKGLNIFNAKYVLASPETATDREYELIEAIIAHEYFHNWTGNRITCRDWFQLCLKEGLTVFRDQQFTGDMRSHAVKRIDDVLTLRARQFREDGGPLAHPVRPESYIEINNFYTATVYEKGAEVIRMLKALIGDDAYYKGCQLYFDRHDGQACTIEDWLAAFEDATNADLSQFKRWYSQAGTPRVEIAVEQDGSSWSVVARQHTLPTPGQDKKDPQVIPISFQIFDQSGGAITSESTGVLSSEQMELCTIEATERPVVSAFRDFSAPVIVKQTQTQDERLVLLAHDTDPFNKWEAGRALAKDVLVNAIVNDAAAPLRWTEALAQVLLDDSLDPAFRALVLALPREDDLAETLSEAGTVPDPTAIHTARQRIKSELGTAIADQAKSTFEQMAVSGPYSPDAKAAGKRALRLAALDLLTRADGGSAAHDLFASADNMTESLGALTALLGSGLGDEALDAFGERWSQDRLVMDKWFQLKIVFAAPEKAAGATQAMTQRADFDWKNPNRFRAVMGGLAGNQAGFHHPSGDGYRIYTDWLLKLDPANPSTAARMATVFETWKRYDADRKDLIHGQLDRILSTENLSRDMTEIVGRIKAA